MKSPRTNAPGDESVTTTGGAKTLPVRGDRSKLIRAIHSDDEMFQFVAKHPLYVHAPHHQYFRSGAKMFDSLSSILAALEIDIRKVERFLDFASGYGRFTRHLIRHLDPARITCSDLYKDAVDFQKAAFGVNGFYSDLVPERLQIKNKFDVIFVASLFSHLPQAVWARWLRILYEALADGGVLVFSVHGSSSLPVKLAMPESGFLYEKASESERHSVENYGTTYVSSQFVHDTVFGETGQPVALEVVKGLFNFQDVFVVRKPSARASVRCTLFNTIFIHAGLPKTGSTYLQNGLQVLSKDGLLKHVAYPNVGYQKDFSHIGSGNGVHASRVMTERRIDESLRKRLETCVQEILETNDSDAKNLLISSEQFFLASPEGWACFKEVLSRHAKNIKLVLSVRPLKSWSYSVYMQMVKAHGLSADYDEAWLNEYFGSSYLDSFKNLEQLGLDTIAFKYQDKGLLPLLLKQIGEDERLGAQVPDVKVNRSLSVAELDVVKNINALFKSEELARKVSTDFVRNWPDIKSAEFPAEGEEHFRRFAAGFANQLEPMNGPVMTAVKKILFSDIDKRTAKRKDADHHDPRYLVDVTLRNIWPMVSSCMRDAQAYHLLKQISRTMEPTDAVFDPIHYLLMYPDLAKPGAKPWAHYQNHGRKEGRKSALVRKVPK